MTTKTTNEEKMVAGPEACFAALVQSELVPMWLAARDGTQPTPEAANRLAQKLYEAGHNILTATSGQVDIPTKYQAVCEAFRSVSLVPGVIDPKLRRKAFRERANSLNVLKLRKDFGVAHEIETWTPLDRIKVPATQLGQFDVVVLSASTPAVAA